MRLSLLLAILPVALAAPATKRDEPAPLHAAAVESAAIPGKYIVKFKKGSASADNRMHIMAEHAEHVYTNVMQGFAGSLDAETLKALRNHPDVEYIEQDARVSINGWVTQPQSTWGLSRISHRAKTAKGYTYDSSSGEGTCVYVIDTGIDDSHPDFGGRALQVKSFVDGEPADGHGHGTHCAGTIASNTYGVAKKTKVYGVKVLDNNGSGSWSNVIAGMDFVVNDSRERDCPGGTLASMSLGGGYSAAINGGAAELVSSGVFVSVAAGNDNRDAANYSPASEESACTVGATTSADARSAFSNHGRIVDIFAPGSNILSLAPGGGTATMSGTSMAAPHIAGLAAYIGGLEGLTGGSICNRLVQLATRGTLAGIPGGTVNLLAFNGNPSG
ncbi:ase T precursor [Cordyceps militaris]|uniref:Ase T n=1 Tax=Cordyceps militaris TaxID=73501 RepID=A0A2H4S5V5_CORMI|nr:ase T precursor [Cordyceps militaris]